MAHVGMTTFDWSEFNAILASPATELAVQLAPCLAEKESTDLPRDSSQRRAFLESLLASDDWYAGKTPREARAIDEFLGILFQNPTFSQKLKIKWMHGFRRGVLLEVLTLANGAGVVDERTNEPRNQTLFIHWKQAQEDYDPSSELSNLGSRPFRYPSWDRLAAEDALKHNNPFLHGADASYFPDYSLHAPEQVESLRLALTPARARLARELDRVKSDRIRKEAMAHFEEDLVAPIEEAARSGRGLIATNDY